MQEEITLRRALGLAPLTYYGLGTIIGAGIYVLVGKVAGHAGLYAPIAFLVAGLIAAFTAFSYAELAVAAPGLVSTLGLIAFQLGAWLAGK